MELSGDRLLLSKVSINDLDFICRVECDNSLWNYEELVQSNEDIVQERHILEKAISLLE